MVSAKGIRYAFPSVSLRLPVWELLFLSESEVRKTFIALTMGKSQGTITLRFLKIETCNHWGDIKPIRTTWCHNWYLAHALCASSIFIPSLKTPLVLFSGETCTSRGKNWSSFGKTTNISNLLP